MYTVKITDIGSGDEELKNFKTKKEAKAYMATVLEAGRWCSIEPTDKQVCLTMTRRLRARLKKVGHLLHPIINTVY